MAATDFTIGDQVRLVGKGVGIVKFVGKHADTGSDRLGIELNKPLGFHNGTVQGHTYFTCPSNCGVLVVPLKAELMIRGADFRDHKSEAGAKLARRRDVIEVGDRVLVPNKGEGFVRYFGPSDLTAADAVRVEGRRPSLVQQELRILHTLAGVELDEPLGKHNGTTEGFAYFKCADLHGYMVLPDKLTLIKKAIDWEDEHRAQVLAKAMGVGKGLDASDGDRVVKNAQAEASSRAAKAQDRKAKDEAKKAAKETAKQAEADRKAADKARKQKEKDDKRAAVKAERERKMREAAATKEGGVNHWERKKGAALEQQMRDLMKAEDDKAKVEEEAAAKLEAKLALRSKFEGINLRPKDVVPSDKTLARKKKGASPSKRGKVPDVRSNGAFVERDTLLQDKYLGKESYLKTLNRPVGGKMKLFEQRFDEFAEDKLAMEGEMVDSLLYVEVLTWSFYNEATASQFVQLLTDVRSADYAAEAYFNIMKLPSKETLNQSGGEYNFLTVAVGTVEQYKQFHANYDIRKTLNAKVSKQTEGAAGIKSVAGSLFCARESVVLREVVADWNKADYCNINSVGVRKLNVPGGWATVARFVEDNTGDDSNDLMITVGKYEGDATGIEGTKNWLEIFYLEYQESAPRLGSSAVFTGMASPVDFGADTTPTSFMTVGFNSGALWLRAKKKVGAAAATDMTGLATQQLYHFGPGAQKGPLTEYVDALNGLNITGLRADIVPELL